MPKAFYVTTPIYYVNSVPHAGHALTMLVADVTKRVHEMNGETAMMLTGTDENALKVFEAAQEAGEDPQAFVDRISQTFKDAADELHINYDFFFRTTSAQHKAAVQALFAQLVDSGYVYLDTYEGWYDVSAETFVRESELVDGKSPDGNEVRKVSEENYFFKLSAFGDRLLEHAEQNPEFWLPLGRKAEVVSFIKQGLRDICITRSNPGWGIPVPGDESKVVYVWFDALINYLAATGWPNPGWQELWPAEVHWMAKEIYVRFHATLWPAMLMAAGLPLPKTVIAHGWFTFNDAKMSKSKGNVIAPSDLISHFEEAGCSHEIAVDVARFSLIRTLPFDNDSNFAIGDIEKQYNAGLANDLGNALNRTITMVHKFTEGVVPNAPIASEMQSAIAQAKAAVATSNEELRFHDGLEATLELVRDMNRFIADRKPWELAKTNDASLPSVLTSLLFALRAVEGLVRPIMPNTANAMLSQLGYKAEEATTLYNQIGEVTRLNVGAKLAEPTPIFPRYQPPKMETQPTPAIKPEPQEAKAETQAPMIEITDFMKVNLRVARILEAEAVPDSEKLVKLQVIIGEERRQIIAGILKSYDPANLVGMQIVVITNLKPRKLAGLESQGMVLAADGPDGKAILLTTEAECPEGASVH
ncbi:MAG: methionine--tRNA ligase [Chthonomonas sp.]|nr:methionine--tRNA ligase [Chthonomonas sp.]